MEIDEWFDERVNEFKHDGNQRALILAYVDDVLQCTHRMEGKEPDIGFILTSLPRNLPRYIVIKLPCETDELPVRKIDRLILVLWIPAKASAQARFNYSQAVSDFRESFGGIHRWIIASEPAHISEEILRDVCL